MKKLLLPALMLSLLTGCGTNHLTMASSTAAAALAAQSKAGVEKGIHAMFRAAFVAADLNKDGKLTLAETPLNLPVAPVPGVSVVAPQDGTAQGAQRQALFLSLDLNKDGVITFREFARPDAQQAATVFYRSEVAKIFAQLDKNGDHTLTANELEGSTFTMAAFDTNGNGKVTPSEFEDALLKAMGTGPDPVPAPGPVPAPVPAPTGDTPAPAPAPADTPAPAPAPADQPAAS